MHNQLYNPADPWLERILSAIAGTFGKDMTGSLGVAETADK